ncbi:MAG: PQQ-binding-like beta-propeller repeat protein [Limisphaerales bacterium]
MTYKEGIKLEKFPVLICSGGAALLSALALFCAARTPKEAGHLIVRSPPSRLWGKTRSLLAFLLLSRLAALGLAQAESAADNFWPQWRGPLLNGVAPQADPPLTWSETNNVKWKTPLPGEGDSTPIVWDNRIFILSAIAMGGPPATAVAADAPHETYQWVVICLDRGQGKVLWQKTARQEMPHEGHQENNTFASASPITDGKLLLAYFGSRGLHCYDLAGNLIWEKDFGKMKTKMGFGEGSSPALSDNTVVVNWDTERDGFITALDEQTGKELWRTPRDEGTSWSTPLILESDGRKQVIVSASIKVHSYDLATGRELWSCSSPVQNAIPCPVTADGLVFLASGARGSAVQAIRLGRDGDLTGSDAIAWSHDKGTPPVPSPLLTDNLLYVLQGSDAILSCFNARNGEAYFDRQRLEAIHSVYASPVSAKDRVYILSREGKCVVLRKGPKPEVLAINRLDDDAGHTDASMALTGGEAFIRTPHHLYCLARP